MLRRRRRRRQGVHGIETAEGDLVACGKCDEDGGNFKSRLPPGCTDAVSCGYQQAYVILTDANGNVKWG